MVSPYPPRRRNVMTSTQLAAMRAVSFYIFPSVTILDKKSTKNEKKYTFLLHISEKSSTFVAILQNELGKTHMKHIYFYIY